MFDHSGVLVQPRVESRGNTNWNKLHPGGAKVHGTVLWIKQGRCEWDLSQVSSLVHTQRRVNSSQKPLFCTADLLYNHLFTMAICLTAAPSLFFCKLFILPINPVVVHQSLCRNMSACTENPLQIFECIARKRGSVRSFDSAQEWANLSLTSTRCWHREFETSSPIDLESVFHVNIDKYWMRWSDGPFGK